MNDPYSINGDPDGPDEVPPEWRLALAELFAEAERAGLGKCVGLGFTAFPGREVEAADYVKRRMEQIFSSASN